MDELVDIINEKNAVIQTMTKKEAHVKGLLHRCVIAEVRTSDGRWLFTKQAPHKQDPGQFVSPMGGHVQAGESIEDALKRETEEELGIKDFQYVYRGSIVYDRTVRDHRENHYFIVYEIYSDEKPTLNNESVNFVYLTEDELKDTLKNRPQEFGDAFLFLTKTLYTQIL